MNGPTPTLTPPAASSGGDAPRDGVTAKILCAGLLVTAVIGSPAQFVLPDTIKSVAGAACAITALIAMVWRLQYTTSSIRWSAFLLAPFGLALLAFLSTLWAPATMAVTEGVRWLIIAVIITVGLNVLDRNSFPALARAAHWSAVFLSLLAMAQFWFNLSWFPATSEPGANFGNRNFFAEFIVAALPFSLWTLARQRTLRGGALAGLSVGVVAVAFMSTGSRAALIAACAGLVAALVVGIFHGLRGGFSGTPKAALWVGWMAPLLVVGVLGSIPTGNANILEEHATGARGLTPITRATHRLATLTKDSTYVPGSSFGIRRSAWEAGGKMIAAHPVLGVGAGAWNAIAPLYLPETIDTELVWFAHNEPLQLIAEYGLFAWGALLALAALVATTMVRAARARNHHEEPDQVLQACTAVVSLLMLGIASLAGLPLHNATTVYIMALSIGYLVSVSPHRSFAIAPAAHQGWLLAGRIAAGCAAFVMLAIGVQAMRSDALIQSALGKINLALQERQLPRETIIRLRTEAVSDLRKGLSIYSDHGYVLVAIADSLAALEDPASVLWLSNMMLATRPHVVGLKCNLVRAYSDSGNFSLAGIALESLQKSRPNAVCLPLSQFVYEFKQARFPQALATGQKLIQSLDEQTRPEVARYIVDMSYRAAVRVPDVDAAIAILRLRAERWQEFRASSWLLIGQLLASRSPATLIPEATSAFRTSLAAAASDQERQAVLSRVPENYKAAIR